MSSSEGAVSALLLDAALSRRATALGWFASLLVHGALLGALYLYGQVPDYGFAFEVPAELELGMTDAVALDTPPTPPARDEPPPPPRDEASGATPSEPGSDAPSALASADAGVPRDAARARRRRDAGPEAVPSAPSEPRAEPPPVAFLPAGGQVAMRLDLDRVRDSQVRADVEALLAVVPDWQILLGESGIEPVRDLSRVLVATPNFQRRSLVVAGRLAEGAADASAIVERTAQADEDGVGWAEIAGVPTTRWPSDDGTERRVAILEERLFVIARPDDLPRVLAIAAARAQGDASSTADALLALPEGAAITVEVEGVRSYARRSPCAVPTRLSSRADPHALDVEVSLHAIYDTAEEATEAARCFESLRARVVRNPFVSFAGMGPALTGLRFAVEGASLDAHTTLSYGQVRTLLRYARGMLEPPTPPPPSVTPVPPPGAASPTAPPEASPPPPVPPPPPPVPPPPPPPTPTRVPPPPAP